MSYENKNFNRFISDDILIGKGFFGEVYGPCDWDGKKCAIRKRWITEEDTEKEYLAYHKWMALHHTSKIGIYDVSLEPPGLYVLMEYAGGGSLREALSACTTDLPLEILKEWGIQIAEGMAYLHENDIVHKYLKSTNIVLMEPNTAPNLYNQTLKITDFDQIREDDATNPMSTARTCAYAAPEVLDSGTFSKASDVWSYGVVVWEISTRSDPYEGAAAALQGTLIMKTQHLRSDIIKSILSRCLSTEKSKRPQFVDILLELQRNHSEDLSTKNLKQKDETQTKPLDKIMLRAVQSFDPRRMTASERIAFNAIIHNQRLSSLTSDWNNNSSDDEVDLYAKAIPFKNGDRMEVILPANICDRVEWWEVRHLNSCKIGFIPRNRVVIEFDRPSSMTTMNMLPLELLDIIVEKSVLHFIRNSAIHQKDEDVINSLALVENLWFQRLRKLRLKRRFWRRMKDLHDEIQMSSAITSNNRNYLLENIQPSDALIDSMLSLNCITKGQSYFIQRQRSNRDKNSDILFFLKPFDQTKHSNFIRCLRQTNQNTVARIVENGGGLE